MFVNLGGPERREDLVGLLLECHERIRRFSRLAVEVATRVDLSPHDLEDACARCERYFVEALPKHVADEELTLLPRLKGMGVDAALATMHAQHETHAPLLVELLEGLRQLRAEPSAQARERLATVARSLVAEFDVHLEAEERLLFPLVPTVLSAEQQRVAIIELRSRRQAGA
ncbi:MAG: hemerythrin domain-containing protein [Archangiaceae bacterium]|nr:hemerythrin domain-containing protein [Archangiaceae bacterium]